MSILTPFFNLIKPAKTDPTAISQLNSDMDIIDTEMHRPPLTVNETEPDENRNIQITTVPLADNLTSDEAQVNQGTYILRASGGEASIANGSAWLSDIHGNMVKAGYVPESITMTVTPAEDSDISATIDRDTFVEAVSASGTITLTYTTEWSANPETYGITVTGTPVNGDQIVVVYVKENRGTITTSNPTSFVSTGWNLYNHSAGYARVVKYSDEYAFMIDGTYTGLTFAETLSGEQTAITPVDGYFTLPAGAENGYVFVSGGNSTDTAIWMTWSDWIDEANGGVFEPYSQTSVDLSGIMVSFPFGLMRVGNTYDEINLNTLRAYSRIERMAYTEENLADVIASGVPYDTDTGYIYAVRTSPVTYTISISGEYTVSDHGMEMFLGTSVAVTASSLYGNDLKGKLRRDVLTISQQTLTEAQKAQVQENIGVDTIKNQIANFAATNYDNWQRSTGHESGTTLVKNTWTSVAYQSLPAGTYYLSCCVNMGTSQTTASLFQRIILNNVSNVIIQDSISAKQRNMPLTQIIKLEETSTIYLQAYSNDEYTKINAHNCIATKLF